MVGNIIPIVKFEKQKPTLKLKHTTVIYNKCTKCEKGPVCYGNVADVAIKDLIISYNEAVCMTPVPTDLTDAKPGVSIRKYLLQPTYKDTYTHYSSAISSSGYLLCKPEEEKTQTCIKQEKAMKKGTSFAKIHTHIKKQNEMYLVH